MKAERCMSDGGRARSREIARFRVCVFCVVAALGSCSRKSAPSSSEQSSSAPGALSEDGSAPPAPREPGLPPRCELSPNKTAFYLRGRSSGGEASEGGVDQPFAAELGSAAALASGFAVGALRHDGGQTEALVAVTDGQAARGQVHSLGRVHGAVEPPRLVARGDSVLVAVPDSDASGPTLRLARFEASSASSVVWGPEVQQGRDESSAFSLALGPSGSRGLLVWDDYDRAKKHGVVRALPFQVEPFEQAGAVRSLSPAGEDADSPLLAPRLGGYWLAWLAHAEEPALEDDNAKPEADEALAVVQAGPSRLRIAPLDEGGALMGEPRFVTPPSSQVVAFDLISSPDGAAHLTWRDEARAPGGGGGALFVASQAPDGTSREHKVELAGLEAGLPALLQDEYVTPSPSPSPWLAASGGRGELLLGLVTPAGVEDLYPEPALATRQALSLGHGRVLLAQPRGLDVLLETALCTPRSGAAASPAPVDAAREGGSEGGKKN